MRIGQVDIAYLSHVCFHFTSPGGRVLITDPFFGPGFQWMGHFEKYLSPPAVKLQEIRRCDAVFVSHSHGDHFDRTAVLGIQRKSRAVVVAPAEVVEALTEDGADPSLLRVAEEGARFAVGDLVFHTYCGYDNSSDALGRPNKFALVIACGPTRLFYSGDCHELPPAVRGLQVDAMFSWPHPVDDNLVRLARGLQTRRFVLMHGDRFEPGEFYCNMDYAQEKRRLEALLPGIEVIIPVRVSELPPGRG